MAAARARLATRHSGVCAISPPRSRAPVRSWPPLMTAQPISDARYTEKASQAEARPHRCYTKSSKTWTLYWRDRNSRFHRYDPIEPSANVGALIDEIDYDPTGIFCG